MEAKGDSAATVVSPNPASDFMDERGDASSHGGNTQVVETQESEASNLDAEPQAAEQSVTESKPDEAPGPTSAATNNGEKDSIASDENVDLTQDDKEGSSDSQSEPFEMLKIPDQGEATPTHSNIGDEAEIVDDTKDVDPDSVKEKDVPVEKEEEDGCMDILGNGLLRKKVTKKGEGHDSRPQHGDMVTLKAEGRLDNGTVVDKQEAVTFALGDGDVIQAWDLAVSLMETGEHCELITAAKYAFGATGREPDIPADATITYTLELVSKEQSPMLSSLSLIERLKKGETKRERGNFLFGRKDYTGAINSYSKAITVLEYPGSTDGAETNTLQEVLDSKLKCYNNLAASQLKIDAYDAAIRSCEGVLKSQPDNVKALYRIGKAYSSKGENEKALSYLKKALSIDPASKIIHAELSKLSQKLKADTDSERAMYRRMMGANKPSKKPSGGPSWWKMPLIFGGVMAGVVSVGLAVAYRYGQH
ncbi:peptidyl-prolyl cis-trans isomerase FKBP8-like [Haliotis cracherodii]|uniref:peptidyl-prolyl cis-trans isomerase FKBP8-like n=1 Tax=Haliotis cracherodii TaxID=6455 RepID=UPI0039E77B5A